MSASTPEPRSSKRRKDPVAAAEIATLEAMFAREPGAGRPTKSNAADPEIKAHPEIKAGADIIDEGPAPFLNRAAGTCPRGHQARRGSGIVGPPL